MHACRFVCMHACMHVCLYVCMYVCMYVFMHVCTPHPTLTPVFLSLPLPFPPSCFCLSLLSLDAPGEGEVPMLAAEDLEILKEFVNPVYLKDDASLKVCVCVCARAHACACLCIYMCVCCDVRACISAGVSARTYDDVT